MNKRVVFRGMDHSSAVEKYVRDNFVRIDRFFDEHAKTPITVDIVFESHPTHAAKKCEIRIFSPEYNVIVSEEGQDMYKLVHDVIDNAYLQLLHQKEKVTDSYIHGSHKKK